MLQKVIDVVNDLIELDHFAKRLFHASKLLDMEWKVQIRHSDGSISKEVVTGVTNAGCVLFQGVDGGSPLYHPDLLAKPGPTPWLVDEQDPLFVELNRIYAVYNREVTVQSYDPLPSVLPWSKFLIDRYPVYNNNPHQAIYLSVNPINKMDGYRINHNGKLAWWTGEGKYHKYDVVDMV